MGKSHHGAHKQRHSRRLHHGALTSDKDLKGVSFALGLQTSGENIHFNEKKKNVCNVTFCSSFLVSVCRSCVGSWRLLVLNMPVHRGGKTRKEVIHTHNTQRKKSKYKFSMKNEPGLLLAHKRPYPVSMNCRKITWFFSSTSKVQFIMFMFIQGFISKEMW